MPNKIWLSESDYDFIYSQVPRLCVDVVIQTSHGVLLTKRNIQPYKGSWHLPGGRVLFRESLADAAQRIIKEELGLKIAVQKMIGFMEFFKEVQNKSKRHSVSIVFLAVPTSGKIKKDFQSIQAKFFKKFPKPIIPSTQIFYYGKNY